MAEYIAKDGEERGALMLEAIALLGLMTMMSPMVVRQTADRTAEMEEVAVAGQMKTLRDAVSSYIEANYANIAAEGGNTRAVTLDQLRPYLPPSFIQGGAVSNKLINDYDFRLRKECTDGAAPNCNRWKIMGLVVSGRANDGTAGGAAELDVRRAARIATMIGADGGYTPSTDSGQNGNVIHGAQGIWEGNVTDFGIAADSAKGRVVAATTYASSVGGDFLYRHAVNGLPEANSMFTDIDMSGQGSGAHRIRHSGGLEVINGKIVVRRNRVNDWNSTNDEAVHIDKDTIKSNGASVDLNMDDSEQARIAMNRNDGILLKNRQAQLNLRAGAFLSSSTQVGISSTGSASTTIDSARDISVDAGNNVDISGGNTVDVEATNKLSLTSTSGAVNIKASGYGIDKGINLNTVNANGNGSSKYHYGLFMRSSSPSEWKDAASAQNRMVGGLNLYAPNVRTPLSITGYTKGGGQRVTTAFSDYFYDDKSLLMHMSTDDSPVDLPHSWSATEPRADVNLGAGLTHGGHLVLGSKKERRAELRAYDNSGSLTMFQSKADGGSRFESETNTVMLSSGGGTGDLNGAFLLLGPGKKRYNEGVKDGKTLWDLWANRMYEFNAGQGISRMPYFEARTIALKAHPTRSDDYGSAIRNRIQAKYSDTGVSSSSTLTIAEENADLTAGERGIINQLDSSSAVKNGFAVTDSYGGNTVFETVKGKTVAYNRFKVDPAFVSVMNDIKLTSRGGAHLADILPNYINKGIYVLSNTYRKGPWPCSNAYHHKDANCRYDIPRVKKSDPSGSAIVSGAWESNCTEMNKYNEGLCSNTPGSDKSLTVNYYNDSYLPCSPGTACLTHPYLGAVPAPGRSVNDGTGVMAAFDEGPCPDGYLPVMTVTPTAIEVGKVNHIDMRIDMGGTEEDSYVYYNLENVDFSSNRASIYQPATSVSTAVLPVDQNGNEAKLNPTTNKGVIHGWKVALGTVSTSTYGGYYWNQGGVWQDSMKAVVHTYCYFNPSRFTFPNMVIDGSVLKAMPAPRLSENTIN